MCLSTQMGVNMQFSHINEDGAATMVDVSGKENTVRTAVAKGEILMNQECFSMCVSGSIKKGDIFAVARIAGIMGAKKTAELIPLCHVLNLTDVQVEVKPNENKLAIEVVCTVKTVGKTGVEMEALTGVSIALLTIYDMCKAVDKEMIINNACLYYKTGGKSGEFIRKENNREQTEHLERIGS